MNELYPLKSMTTPHTISLGYTLAGKESRIIYDTADQDFLVESVALDDVSETIPAALCRYTSQQSVTCTSRFCRCRAALSPSAADHC